MSTSQQAKLDFAKTLLNHSALEAVREDVQHRLFQRFRTANPQEREIINHILDAESLFFKEIKTIVAQNENLQETENDE